ncbi:hypothetical protein [Hymenobacter coccineus]|nr:hypothetical protein [Hymenobacter coccineus]
MRKRKRRPSTSCNAAQNLYLSCTFTSLRAAPLMVFKPVPTVAW